MAYIQPGLSVYGVTGITGGFTGEANPTYGMNNIRVSWLTDQNSILNIEQTPDGTTPMFNDTYTGTTGNAYTVVVPVKSEYANVNMEFGGTPGALTLETFFFNGTVTSSSIITQQLSSATGTVSFSNINQSGTNIILTGSAQAENSTLDSLNLNFNGDVGSNYIWSQLYQNGAVAAGANSGGSVTAMRAALLGCTGSTGMSSFKFNVLNYTNQLIQKPCVGNSWCHPDNVGNQYNAQLGGLWRGYNSINQIKITLASGNKFAKNSIFNLQII